MIAHEQKLDDRKMVITTMDKITVWMEYLRSDEWKGKGRVSGAKLKQDFMRLNCIRRPMEECLM